MGRNGEGRGLSGSSPLCGVFGGKRLRRGRRGSQRWECDVVGDVFPGLVNINYGARRSGLRPAINQSVGKIKTRSAGTRKADRAALKVRVLDGREC